MLRPPLIVSLCLVLATASAEASPPELGSLLRPGRYKAQELQPKSSPRFIELGNRLKQAAENDPDWAQEQLTKTKPGEPLPYDPKMGLTEAEYREFLKLGENITMKVVRTVTVVVEPTLGGWRFGPATTATALHGYAVDTLRNQVHSPYGDLNAGSPVEASDLQRATGRWSGHRWRGDFMDPQTQAGSIIVLSVGRIEATGRTVVYLEKRRIDKGRVMENTKSFFRYLPAGKAVTTKAGPKKGVAKKSTARKAG